MWAYLPPLLVVLFGAWAGTFHGGAGFAGSVMAAAALLASASTAAIRGWVGIDPLGLGRAGRWLLAALLLTVLASWWASPVPRAGRVGLLLMPAVLLLPGLVAAVWREPSARRQGLRALSLGVAAIAIGSLLDPLTGGFPRAAAPLGHHNLLALWLLTMLPMAVSPAREPGGWRWLGWAAGVLGTGALLATRSLLGAAGLAVLGLAVLVLWGGRVRARLGNRAVTGGALVGLGMAVALAWVFGSRLVDIVAGRDPSAQARTVYWSGGIEGFLERPLLGWGPGATPWTLGAFLHPEPGVNPPGEVVGQLHSQPLQLVYELGAPGLALVLAIVALFALRRIRELLGGEKREDPGLALAGLAGLAAAGVAFLGTAALDVPAIPVAVAVAVGAVRVGGRTAAAGRDASEAAGVSKGGWGVALYVVIASLCLVPVARAHFHYQRALGLGAEAAAREMASAVALDPSFPWYRAWSAWLGGSDPLGRQVAAETALEAARGAPGVAPLWLTAGVYGLEARAPWADAALARACRLDPLGPLAPFHRMTANPEAPRAPRYGARALLAEPRLLAAVFWDRHPALRAAALAEVAAWPGAPEGWREAIREAAEATRDGPGTGQSPGRDPERARIATTLDREASASVALHVFRRRSRPLDLVPVTVDRRRAESIRIPPASILRETAPEAFGVPGCAGGSPEGAVGASLSTGSAENLVENP